LGIKLSSLPPLPEFPYVYYDSYSINRFIAHLKELRSILPKNAVIVFDFNSQDSQYISSIVFGNQYSNKTKFFNYSYFTIPNHTILNILSKDLYFITDKKFDKFINSNQEYAQGALNIYNYDKIIDQGFLSIQDGTGNFNWQTGKYPIHATFLVPKNKIGQKLKLSVSLKPRSNLTAECRRVKLGLQDQRGIIWIENDFDKISAIIPAHLTESGFLRTILSVNPVLAPNLSLTTSKTGDNQCSFDIISFNLY
jgi:hypothetical protein